MEYERVLADLWTLIQDETDDLEPAERTYVLRNLGDYARNAVEMAEHPGKADYV